MLKVLPEPVTPNKTCLGYPAAIPSDKTSIALGWSPAGVKDEISLNCPDKMTTVNFFHLYLKTQPYSMFHAEASHIRNYEAINQT
jgi:hypothetical protein